MNQNTIILRHRKEFRIGLLIACAAILSIAALIVFHDQIGDVPPIVLIFMILTILLVAVVFLIKGKSVEILAPDGITRKSVFGTKTYLWQDIRSIRVEYDHYIQTPFRGREQVAKIRIECYPYKVFRLDYRQDIEAFLFHYHKK